MNLKSWLRRTLKLLNLPQLLSTNQLDVVATIT